jgi:CheY-like chemotaxis protein
MFPESPELVLSLLEDYVDQSDGFVGALDGAIKKGASREVKNVAHEWKGASATCGIDCLVEPLEKLENLGETGNLSEARAIFGVVTDCWLDARKALKLHFSDFETTGPRSAGTGGSRNSVLANIEGTSETPVASVLRQLNETGEQWIASGSSLSAGSFVELRRVTQTLAETAHRVGNEQCTRLAVALDVLLIAIEEQPKKATSSCARTVEQALKLMPVLAEGIRGHIFDRDSSPTILVVDDSDLSRRVLLAALEAVQLSATSLGDAMEALEVMQSRPLDLVFLDINMPEMSGIELCQKMQTFEPNANTPVLFVSGLRDPDTILDSIGSGAVDFITKPVLLQEISLKALIYLFRPKL